MSIDRNNGHKKGKKGKENGNGSSADSSIPIPTGAAALVFRNRETLSEEELVISAADTKGHTEAVWVRIQPGYLREVKMLIAERRFPWKSIGDIMRFGLDQTIRWAVKEKTLKNSILPQIDMINGLVRDQTMQHQLIQTFDAIKEMLSYKGPRAKKIANDVWREINKMPDGYWKDQYMQEFMAQWGELVGGVRLSETIDKKSEDLDGQEQEK